MSLLSSRVTLGSRFTLCLLSSHPPSLLDEGFSSLTKDGSVTGTVERGYEREKRSNNYVESGVICIRTGASETWETIRLPSGSRTVVSMVTHS